MGDGDSIRLTRVGPTYLCFALNALMARKCGLVALLLLLGGPLAIGRGVVFVEVDEVAAALRLMLKV